MLQFYEFITWRFVLLNMLTGQTTTNNAAATTTLQGKTRGC
jgi:hypothetical protein